MGFDEGGVVFGVAGFEPGEDVGGVEGALGVVACGVGGVHPPVSDQVGTDVLLEGTFEVGTGHDGRLLGGSVRGGELSIYKCRYRAR